MNQELKDKFPFGPGLSLEQAQECAAKIREQYSEQIADSKYIENRLGISRSYSDYVGKR